MKTGLVKGNLTVVIVEDDVLICNLDLLKTKLTVAAVIPVIDVSANLEDPVLLGREDVGLIVCDIQRAVQSCSESACSATILDISLPAVLNRTTVFRYLLDYPVLYWYTLENSTENCLSMVPLRNWKVTVKLKWGGTHSTEHVAWSFSCPENCAQAVEPAVTQWFNIILLKTKDVCVVDDIRLQTERVVLPAVAL